MAAKKGNKYAVGNNGGRPPIYDSPNTLSKKVDEYFVFIQGKSHTEKKKIKDEAGKVAFIEVEVWDRHPEPATITGLVLFLGFSHREALSDYQKKNEFSDIIKKARTRVEHEYEKRLYGDKNVGCIFALKNMGWKDKQEIEHNGNIHLSDQPIEFE